MRKHGVVLRQQRQDVGERLYGISMEMLEHYSHIRQEAKRKAVASLDNVTITSQLAKWKEEADERKKLELKQKTKK